MSTTLVLDSVVNGIDTDAVRTLIESVKAEPGKGMSHWRVANTCQHGTHSCAQIGSSRSAAPMCASVLDRYRRASGTRRRQCLHQSPGIPARCPQSPHNRRSYGALRVAEYLIGKTRDHD